MKLLSFINYFIPYGVYVNHSYVPTQTVGWPQPSVRSGSKLSGKCNIGAIIAPYFNAAIER